MGNTGKGVVIPFHGARAGLWAADLVAVEGAHEDLHPAPARLGSFVRGELSREDNRAVVRHLLTGCPACAAVLRPLLGQGRPPAAADGVPMSARRSS